MEDGPKDEPEGKGEAEAPDGEFSEAERELEEDLSEDLLEAAKKEAAGYLDALQRERADFINFRNRADREKELARQAGVESALKAFLPVLDDLDRIREHGKLEGPLKAVSKQMDQALTRLGIEKFGKRGESFDPAFHEAVLHNPKEGAEEETVEAVSEAGYKINGKIIRAARVVVSTPKPKSGGEEEVEVE